MRIGEIDQVRETPTFTGWLWTAVATLSALHGSTHTAYKVSNQVVSDDGRFIAFQVLKSEMIADV